MTTEQIKKLAEDYINGHYVGIESKKLYKAILLYQRQIEVMREALDKIKQTRNGNWFSTKEFYYAEKVASKALDKVAELEKEL